MTNTSATGGDKRSIWLRALLMILMALAFHVSAIVLCVAALIQFVLALVTNGPNERLTALGKSLGMYLGQVAAFVSFATEELPFPFQAWPSSG